MSTYDYTFDCAALNALLRPTESPAATVIVTHWQGTEGLSRPYRFDITFAVAQGDLDLEKLLDEPATLTTTIPDGGTRHWHGIVTMMGEAGADENYRYYQVTLEPRLVRLRNRLWSDIYLKHDLTELIQQMLEHAGLTNPYSTDGVAYDYRIAASQMEQTRREFVCQYEETCLDFLMRKLEHYGVYFWFEQEADRESLVFANEVAQQPTQADSAVYYPKGILDPEARQIAIARLNRRVGLSPKKVVLRSSQEYSNTKVTLASHADVPAGELGGMQGEIDTIADDFEQVEGDNSVSGTMLARWRAEELACRRQGARGEASTPGIRPARFLSVSEYQRGMDPRHYYVTEVTHEGVQSVETTPETDQVAYRGTFAALPRWLDPAKPDEALQYRPPRNTPIPLITKLINGFIDVADPNQPQRFAQPDDKGRYKVRFLFARERYKGDRNSAFVRMATPYAGGASALGLRDAGMHFPLREGTEVLLAFLKGNPDRPVIVATLPNSEAPSPVTDLNPADHVISTPGGNRLVMQDAEKKADGEKKEQLENNEGHENRNGDRPGKDLPSMEVYSPTANSTLVLGKNEEADNGWMLKTDNHGELFAGDSLLIEVPGHYRVAAGGGDLGNYLGSEVRNLPPGISIGQSGGLVIESFVGAKVESVAALTVEHFFGPKVEITEALSFEHFLGAKAELNEGAVAETCMGVKLSVEANKSKELNLTEKWYTHDLVNFTNKRMSLIGASWRGILAEKEEKVGTIETTAYESYTLQTPKYTVKSPMTEMSGLSLSMAFTSLAELTTGATQIMLDPVLAALKSDTVVISATGQVSISGSTAVFIG